MGEGQRFEHVQLQEGTCSLLEILIELWAVVSLT